MSQINSSNYLVFLLRSHSCQLRLIHKLGHYFAEPLHKDTYPAIDSGKADLTGKSVFISGGSKGIGKATTLSFAKAGASFIAVGARSNLQPLEKAVHDAAVSAGKKPPQFLPISLDVTSKESVEDAAAEVKRAFGKLDILINNAGVVEAPVPIADGDPDIWWNTWIINLRGPYLVTRAFLPLLLKGEYKTIVITNSVGAFGTLPGLSAYQSGKLALLRFADFVNREYGDKGILIYSIHPGSVLTEIFDTMGGLPENMRDRKTRIGQDSCSFVRVALC